jgi:hypothetical protein
MIDSHDAIIGLAVVIAMMVQKRRGDRSYKLEMDMVGFNIGRWG